MSIESSLIESAVVDVHSLNQLDNFVQIFLCEADRLRRQVLENTTPLSEVRRQCLQICGHCDLSDLR